MVGVVQNEAQEYVSRQVAWMVRGTLTYSAATGMNGILVIQHYMTHTFICLFCVDKKKREKYMKSLKLTQLYLNSK